MAVGPKDRIDELITQAYSGQQTLCTTDSAMLVSPEKMLDAMQDYATMQKMMSFNFGQKFKTFCASVASKSNDYRSSLPA